MGVDTDLQQEDGQHQNGDVYTVSGDLVFDGVKE
jgi:hypothetical protein